MKKGQAAIEYLVLTGFTLVILMILLVSAYTKISSSETVADVSTLQNAVSKLKEASDFVYIHGHPTKLTVNVYLPGLIDQSNSFIGNKTINFAAATRAGPTDVWASTRGEIGWDLFGSSSLPSTEGYYLFIVESTAYGSLNNGTINIYR